MKGSGFCRILGSIRCAIRDKWAQVKAHSRTMGKMIERTKEHVVGHDWRPIWGGDMGNILSPDIIQYQQPSKLCERTV